MTPSHPELTSRGEILVRFIFVARYGCFFTGVYFSLAALHYGSLGQAGAAISAFLAMTAGHVWIRRDGRLERCEKNLNALLRSSNWAKENDERDRLESLLEQRDALERKRGTPGFDPWDVQVLRREINACLRAHPELLEWMEKQG